MNNCICILALQSRAKQLLSHYTEENLDKTNMYWTQIGSVFLTYGHTHAVFTYLSFEFAGDSARLPFSSVCLETLYRLRSRETFVSGLLLASTIFRLGGFGGSGRDLEDCLEKINSQNISHKRFYRIAERFETFPYFGLSNTRQSILFSSGGERWRSMG